MEARDRGREDHGRMTTMRTFGSTASARFAAVVAATVVAAVVAACATDRGGNAPAAALALDCAALKSLQHPATTILRAERIEQDAAGTASVRMPAHCLVSGEIAPRTGTDGVRYAIGFELRIPLTWNGRFQFQGGGGVDGTIPPAFGTLRDGVMPALAQGTAVVTSNMGHTGTSTRDATFGLDPQARIDWGYNAMDKVTVLAKALVTRFHGKAPAYSYYVGCSGGGRQGMMMSQRFPQHFDGVVSGAPILEQHLAQVGSMQQLRIPRHRARGCERLEDPQPRVLRRRPPTHRERRACEVRRTRRRGRWPDREPRRVHLRRAGVAMHRRQTTGLPLARTGRRVHTRDAGAEEWRWAIAVPAAAVGHRHRRLARDPTRHVDHRGAEREQGDEPVDPLRVHDTAGTRVRLLRLRLRPRPDAPARVSRVHHDQRNQLRRLQGARRQNDRLQRPERFAREPGRRQPLVSQPGRRERGLEATQSFRASSSCRAWSIAAAAARSTASTP